MSAVDWNSLNVGDTITIEVLENMKITGQNNGRHSGGLFETVLPPGHTLTARVTKIGKILEVARRSGDGENHYDFPIEQKKNLKIVMREKYVPPPPPTDEEIAAMAAKEEERHRQREAENKERDQKYERLEHERKLKREQQEQQKKVRQEERRRVFGPWSLNNINKSNLTLGDTVIIEVLENMKISGQNNGRHSGGLFETDLPTGHKLIGEVTKIGEILEISKPTGDGDNLYDFPIEQKKNLKIVMYSDVPDVPEEKELTEQEFIQEYQPWKKSPEEICQLIQNYPYRYKNLHDNGVLPKKIDIFGKQFKKHSHYKCNNGKAYFASILSRAFGSKSTGGNKKSRKIYKKKTKNRTKTKKKKSRTSIKTHKLKKTSRRS